MHNEPKITAHLSSLVGLLFSIPLLVAGFSPAIAHSSPDTNCMIDSLKAVIEKSLPLDPSQGQIHYQLSGRQNPETVVLVHGLDSAGATFDTITEKLSKKFQVLVYDQRGHGQTLAKGSIYSTQVLAYDLKALLDHLTIRQVHLLGHSLGGRTVARFAALYPDRVKTVIIEDMELQPRSQLTPDHYHRVTELADHLDEKFKNKTFSSRQALIDALDPFYGKEAESLTYRRARENSDGTVTLLFNPGVGYRYGYQANTEDLGKALASAKKAVLFIGSDPHLGSAMTDRGFSLIQSDLPDARVIQIPGAGHTIHRSHPDAFTSLVIDFIESH